MTRAYAEEATPKGDAVAPAVYPSAARSWAVVALFVAIYAVSMLDRNLVSLMVPHIKADLGLTEKQMGGLIGMGFALFYVVAALPIGWAMDRFNRPLVICAGVTVWSLATAGFGLARGFWSMFAARSFVAAGEAVIFPGAQSMIAESFPPSKLALPMSAFWMSSKIGVGVAFAAGGALAALIDPAAAYEVAYLGTLKGWQLIFVVAGAPGLLLAPLMLLVRDRRLARSQRPSASYLEYGRFVVRYWRYAIPHHLGLLPLAIAVVGFLAWAPAYFVRVHHLPLKDVGLWLGLAVSGGPVLAMPVHGWVADRLFQRGVADVHLRYTVWCLLGATPFMVAAMLVASPALAFGLIAIFFAVCCPYLSLPATVFQLLVPADLRGTANSAGLAFSTIITIGAGPIITAAVTDALGGPLMVGRSILACTLVGFPLSALIVACAVRPAREMLLARGLAP
jgi:MFS family permease